MSEMLQIQMLGDFVLRIGDRVVNYGDTRSRRSWMLLAYLIYHRHRTVSREELAGVLWENDTDLTDVAASMKTLLHRTRQVLGRLAPDAGFDIILSRNGGFQIHPQADVELDIERFEAVCKDVRQNGVRPDDLPRIRAALDLYKGNFLPRFSMENWVAPVEAYYSDLFISTVLQTAEHFTAEGNFAAVADLCRIGLRAESYNEDITLYLLRSLSALGDREGVIATYEKLQELLYDNFGTMPSEEAAGYYRKATVPVAGEAVQSGTLIDILAESALPEGALECDFDIFRVLYRTHARQAGRSGDVCHVCMFTLTGKEEDITVRSMKKSFADFKEVLQSNLRIGDVVSVCGPYQLVVLLPQANYENATMVCERVERAYRRRFPHTPVDIRHSAHSVQPIDAL